MDQRNLISCLFCQLAKSGSHLGSTEEQLFSETHEANSLCTVLPRRRPDFTGAPQTSVCEAARTTAEEGQSCGLSALIRACAHATQTQMQAPLTAPRLASAKEGEATRTARFLLQCWTEASVDSILRGEPSYDPNKISPYSYTLFMPPQIKSWQRQALHPEPHARHP